MHEILKDIKCHKISIPFDEVIAKFYCIFVVVSTVLKTNEWFILYNPSTAGYKTIQINGLSFF